MKIDSDLITDKMKPHLIPEVSDNIELEPIKISNDETHDVKKLKAMFVVGALIALLNSKHFARPEILADEAINLGLTVYKEFSQVI